MNRAVLHQGLLDLVFTPTGFDVEGEEMIIDVLFDTHFFRELPPNTYTTIDEIFDMNVFDCYRMFRFEPDDLRSLWTCLNLPDFISCLVIYIIFFPLQISMLTSAWAWIRIAQRQHQRRHSSLFFVALQVALFWPSIPNFSTAPHLSSH